MLENRNGQQKHHLPLVRRRRAGGRDVLRQNLPGQHGRRGASRAGRLSGGQAGRRPDGRIHCDGYPCLGLNGGSGVKHNEAFSFQVATDDQAETDRLWHAIVGNGGKENVCGWCQDKWGLSWQITPRILTAAVTDPDQAKAKRAFDAMMTMGKIDIAAIEAALGR